MAEFDFDAARRWARFDPENTLARRSDDELPFVSASLIAGQALLLDTCVYIDQMQDRSHQVLDDLIAQRQVNHSTVAIRELMHTVGVLNPPDPRTPPVVDVIGKQIKAMPPHRIFAPDIEVLDEPRCYRGSSAASRDMKRTASCARFRTASSSCRRKSSASLS